MPSINYTLTRGDDDTEIPVTVEYTYHPFCRGATDGRFGPPIEPDEPAHCEIDSVIDAQGNSVETTESEDIAIHESIMDYLADADDYDRETDY